MRLVLAFFRRDAAIALSYRVAFAIQFLGNLLLLGLLYYIGKTISPQALPALAPYGGSFLAFVLIGIALTDCVLVSLVNFAAQIREAQTTGTLEATLMSPVRLAAVLIYSSLWNYFLSAVRFLFYLILGAILYGIEMSNADIPSAVVIFLLTVLCFMGIGILWAGIILLVKRGESIMTAMGYVVLLISGVFFPVAVLPAWLQKIATVVPLTHALEGMRFALLQGASLHDLSLILIKLAAFAAVLMIGGIAGFNLAVDMAKHTCSLTQY
jgi:ABC-2 type transport system permease protein